MTSSEEASRHLFESGVSSLGQREGGNNNNNNKAEMAVNNGNGVNEPPQQPLQAIEIHLLDAHHRTAVELNNKASAMLELRHGEHYWQGGSLLVPVIATLRDAVEMLSRPAARIRADDDRALSDYIRSNADAVARAEARLAEASVNGTADGTTAAANVTAPPTFFVHGGGSLLIYSRPFRLAAPLVDEVVDIEATSAAVLFNMALTYHLEAAAWTRYEQEEERISSTSTTPCSYSPRYTRYLIDRAGAFYGLCSSMVSQVGANQAPSALHYHGHGGAIEGGLPRLLEALLNNDGQICVEHGDYREGRERFEDLRFLVDPAMGPFEFSFNIMVTTSMNAAPMA